MNKLQTAAKALLKHWDSLQTADLAEAEASVDALRQALEESPDYPTEVVEPVGWVFRKSLIQKFRWQREKPVGTEAYLHWEPVYAHPPIRQPKRDWVDELRGDEGANT